MNHDPATGPRPTGLRRAVGAAPGARRALVLVVTAALVGTVAAVAGTAAQPPPVAAQDRCGTDLATAAPQLSLDRTTLPADAPSTVNVRGSRYLTGPYQCGSSRYGGVYLFFGWVEPGGQWGPSHRSSTSRRGQFGTTYSYPGEGGGAEVRDDGSGTVRLVSFTAGGTSGSETDFHMDPAGNWSAPIVVRGPVYSWNDVVTGATNTVDCRVVQCGIYTVGAHGIASRTNEVFTPVTFTGAGGPPVAVGGEGAVAPPPAAGDGVPSAPGAPIAPGGGAEPAGATGEVSSSPTASPDDPAATAAPDPADEGDGADASTPAGTDADATTTTLAEDVTPTERAAAVQVFESDEGGGGGGALLVALLAALVALGGAAAVLVRRRRTRPASEPTPEAA